jgi:hypothetical protein
MNTRATPQISAPPDVIEACDRNVDGFAKNHEVQWFVLRRRHPVRNINVQIIRQFTSDNLADPG